MRCPVCQTDHEENVRFCSHCGSRLRTPCPSCGHPNPPGGGACLQCACELSGFGGEEGEDASGVNERRQVTVMFCDLSGYTEMTERLDPEEVRVVVNRVFEKTSVIIAKYEGVIERYIGDCVMAAFGIPKAHEDDPVRAVKAALEIHEAVRSLSYWVEDRIGRTLNMHTGINTGLVVTSRVDRDKEAHGLTGHAVNLAARLEGLSRPDEILVGRDTFLQAERAFEFEPLAPADVKGRAEPLEVYRLVARRAAEVPPHRGLRAGLVGRERELAQVEERVERLVRGGRGGVLWVTGEAGIGKSRLLAEVRERTAAERLLWLEGRALSHGQTISYWPFLEIFKAFAGITEEDDELRGWEKLQARINRLFPDEVADTLPYLATLLALEVKGNLTSRVQFLDGESMRRQIFRTSRHFLSRLAREQPLALVFEDAHWADGSTVELIEHLLPLVREHPILFCFLSRSEEPGATAPLHKRVAESYGPHHTALHLQPLADDESERLVCGLLGLNELTPRMREIVQAKSQGNPLFLEELIRALVDAGVIRRDKRGGRWRIRPIPGEVPVPGSLRSLIAAGVDRLDDDIKDVLRVASVIGRSFLYRLLREIIASREALEQDLTLLEGKNLIREKCRIPELEYAFKHDLIKESIYDSIVLERRRTLHRKVGEAIERVFHQHLERFYGLLAYHYAQASDWAKAHEYLIKTGDQAGRMAADSEAVAHYRKAVAAYDRVFGKRWDPVQRAGLERKIGEALFRRGEYGQALESVKRALELLGDPLPATDRELRRGIARNALVQFLHRLWPGLPRRSYAGDPAFEEWAQLRKLLAWIDHCNHTERLLFNILSGLNRVERAGHRGAMAQGYSGLGMILDGMGRVRRAGRYHAYALQSLEPGADPASETQAYTCYGMHLHFTGRREEALGMYDRSASIARGTGDIKQWAVPTLLRSLLLQQVGRVREGLDLCRDIAEAGREVSDEQMVGWGLAGQGRSLLLMNEPDEAEACIEEADRLLRLVPDHFNLVSAMTYRALAAMRKGDEERTFQILAEVRALIEQRSLGGHCVWEARFADAELRLERLARTGVRERGVPPEVKAAMERIRGIARAQRWYRPRWLRLRGTFTQLSGRPRRAVSAWSRALEEASALENRLEEGLTYLAMGKALEEPRCLEKCRPIFSALDDRYHLAQAEQHLAPLPP